MTIAPGMSSHAPRASLKKTTASASTGIWRELRPVTIRPAGTGTVTVGLGPVKLTGAFRARMSIPATGSVAGTTPEPRAALAAGAAGLPTVGTWLGAGAATEASEVPVTPVTASCTGCPPAMAPAGMLTVAVPVVPPVAASTTGTVRFWIPPDPTLAVWPGGTRRATRLLTTSWVITMSRVSTPSTNGRPRMVVVCGAGATTKEGRKPGAVA